jgi:hypothetical protein
VAVEVAPGGVHQHVFDHHISNEARLLLYYEVHGIVRSYILYWGRTISKQPAGLAVILVPVRSSRTVLMYRCQYGTTSRKAVGTRSSLMHCSYFNQIVVAYEQSTWLEH